MTRLPFFNYKFQNNASNGSCDLHIDGAIVDAQTEQIYKEWWNDDTSTSFRSFRNKIDDSGATTVNVYINSGGGQVTEAMAIHDYLVNIQSKGITVNTYGRGIIASAATYILMAGNSTISENSWFMIHNVAGWAYGDVNEMENQAATLRKFNDAITNFYANHTGLSKTVIGNYMDKETWFTGSEAVEKKFIKNVEKAQEFTNELDNSKWLFNNTDVLAAYNSCVSIKNNTDMFNQITAAVKNALAELGIGKNNPENNQPASMAITEEQLTNALDAAFKPLEESFKNEIKELVKNELSADDGAIAVAVKNAITESLKDVPSKDDITNEVKKVNDELETVKESIANKKGGESNPGNSTKSAYDHEGVGWAE